MATDWTSPKTSDTHTNELAATRGRDESNARMDYTGDTNIPDGTIRWNKTNNRFEIWNATTSTWSVLSSKYLINVDTVDGYHAGNASGNVPVSNGTVNTNLNADLLDGQHGTYFQARANHTGTQAPSTISPQGEGSGLDADKLDGKHASSFWHAGNDGSGSGLDADLLDGQHASVFVTGPASSIDGGIAVFDGTDGKAIKDAGFEPIKGPESSTSGNVAIYDGTTGKVLKDGGITSNVWDVIIEDQKPQGTPGGTFESGAWRTRDLNTLVFNHNSLTSLSNNRFTLPAGTYCIDWDAPAFGVDFHKSALYNYTTSTIVAYGTSARSSTSNAINTSSNGTTVITITSPTSFEIRHICGITRNTHGFGTATNLGTEIYTRVRIKKIA